jgi:hypothetical protein
LEPIRIGLVVLMLSRRRPLLQLLAFLWGGFTMGVGVGLVVLFTLRATPLAGHFTVPEVQIATGLIALFISAMLATNVSITRLIRRTPADAAARGGGAVVVLEPTPPSRLQRLSVRARHLLHGDSLFVAGVSGLGAALPSANYMGAMAAILASGAGAVAQAQGLLAFNLVAFTAAEIPLIGYLAAPRRTRAFMAALQAWLRSRSYRDVAVLVAVGGCLMLALGLSNR